MPNASAAALSVLATSGVSLVPAGAVLLLVLCAPAVRKASPATATISNTFAVFPFVGMPHPPYANPNGRPRRPKGLVMFFGDSVDQISLTARQGLRQHRRGIGIEDLYARSRRPRLQQHVRILDRRCPR